ncbi:MAG: rane protein of unknown function [Hyphomicrobiales bacterium]|nr:rane protein of unknown function [Hyphomicrobiales bacterium]
MIASESHSRTWLGCAFATIAAFAIFLILHPYRGIIGDALIYVTREVARFDPNGLGRDFMFVSDRQTDFTIYARLVGWLLNQHLSPGAVAQGLAFAALALWFAAAALFAFALLRTQDETPLLAWREAIVITIFVAVFPLTYAPDATFSAAEALAIPRPFAEALVLACFAFLLMQRGGLAAACLGGAFLVHPLMALAGLGVVYVYLVAGDRRWLWAGAAGLVTLVAAALADVPLANQLFVHLDPEWRALLEKRTRYLFLGLATGSFWASQLVSLVTFFICARVCHGLARRLIVSTIVAALVGLLLSYLFADRWASVLILQLQPWRVLWIASVLAPMAMGILALRLWHGTRSDRLVLACLAIAWLARSEMELSVPLCLTAFVLHLEGDRWNDRISSIWGPILWTSVVGTWLLMTGFPLYSLLNSIWRAPPGLRLQLSYVWTLSPLALPLGALAVAWALTPRRVPVALLSLTSLVAIGLAAVTWDDRPAFQAALEAREAPAELVAALPPGKSPVLWLGGGKETWYWLARPNWAAAIQGAALVFSRPTALKWRERAAALVRAGLEPPQLLEPWEIGAAWSRTLTAEAFGTVCRRSDAPAAIVAPLSADETGPPGARIVSVGIPAFNLRLSTQNMDWERTDRYAVLSCGGTN